MKSEYQENQRVRAVKLIKSKSLVFYGGVGGNIFMFRNSLIF